ncbi:MAG: DNA-processing protein DprA [Patescibacteria group bacterium]
MDFEEKKYWIAFSIFEGIGPMRFKLLLEYFGSAQAAYLASSKELAAIGLGQKLVEDFVAFRNKFNFDSYFVRLHKLGIEAICLEEDSYPKLLKEISDAPFVVYAKNVESIKNISSTKSVAVVGTRKMIDYGKTVTERFTKELVANNFVIVSGLARGVDRIAHETTINNGGKTIAVFGTGLDSVYPPEHKALADRIVESGGTLISEFPLGARISKSNFVIRDRIISGLSLGVVVTEAAQRSGTMITASFAAEQGREVFAVPGPITSDTSKGTSELIKKGAKLVNTVEDILEELNT